MSFIYFVMTILFEVANLFMHNWISECIARNIKTLQEYQTVKLTDPNVRYS